MLDDRDDEPTDRRPAWPVMFGVGMVLLGVGLVCLVLSAFVESRAVDLISGALVPGLLLTPYGWRGRGAM